MTKQKLKVGFFGITGCAGCQLSVIFNEDELLYLTDLIDIKAWPFIKEKNTEEVFDIIFLEGLVASNEDLETLKKLREKTKILVALGACAHTGCIPAYRQFTLKENYEHLIFTKNKRIEDLNPTGIDSYVKVDYTLPGCPPSKTEILEFIKDIALGKTPRANNDPVCNECRRNNNLCLLEFNRLCLGPITAGGCNAICVNGNFECWGCRGKTNDANFKTMINLLKEKGFDEKFIKRRMKSFVGLKLEEVKDA